jgi:asparagine synthase (glutamine-hydrolysing)
VRLCGHIDWSGSRAASAVTEKLLEQRAAATAGEEPFASLSLTSGADGVAAQDRVFLAADARIDNLDEVRARLGGQGGQGGQEGQSLARVLIRAYLAWGDEFADRLVGDFAIVLWDARRRRVLAARDPFGARPLYYRRAGDRLWLASTTAALVATFEGRPALDDERICEHVLWRYKSNEATFFRDVRALRAGHVLAATEATTTATRYWRPPPARPELARSAPEELWGEVRRLFVRSVERRLRTDRPAIVHVSGGLDSSSIAMAANELLASGRVGAPRVIGASEVFPGLSCDEEPFIDAVAGAVRFPVEKWDGRVSNPIDLVEPALEGPGVRVTATSGHDGDVAIARAAGASVILSGLGGDDIMIISGFIRDMITRGDWGSAARAIFLAPGLTLRQKAQRLMYVAGQFLPDGLRALRIRRAANVPDWLAPPWRELARNVEVEEADGGVFSSYVQRLAWARLEHASARQSLGTMQVTAFAADLEYRYPFLDRDLVELVLCLPPQALPWDTPRLARLHREAFRPILPPKIADRFGKAEFSPAVANRVRQAAPLIERLFATGDWLCQKYVARDAALRFYRGVTSSNSTRGMDWWRVWGIATLEAWMRSVFGYPSADKELTAP